ncbi:hypothetical protein CVT26_011868 [Gymnopilus dilepis]|uniref:G domain-containing protein n=1 Tax=Gymnopilus dilepis TaxID=231916 RepID=A0A409W5K1_9AGAR|nr:hypothetical protein CVT26_011868 [Gymnopilus dilepis]
MVLAQLPALPPPPSWFPGHMMKFTRMLPALLKRTNVVLEIRDSRLPLTSINRTLEGALNKWRLERGWDPNNPARRLFSVEACEHIVVLNKRDLVPEWGLEASISAFNSESSSRTCFSSHFEMQWQRSFRTSSFSLLPGSGRGISAILQYPHAMELNVLVIGMPNVGKSTLLNALRNMGIKGRTPKALQTSANPGMTRALSTRLKLSLDPLVYAYDSPGVMLPFLGRGAEGAERGVKLALIAGIKEGLYDMEALAAYLLYRLNVLNPISPAYLKLLPPGSSPTSDLEEFLTLLARRMGMIRRGAEVDLARAAVFFVRWWREEGGLLSAAYSLHLDPRPSTDKNQEMTQTQAWGFDFQWEVRPEDKSSMDSDPSLYLQEKMEQCIDQYVAQTARDDTEEANVSETQIKKKAMLEEKERRRLRYTKR